MHLKKTKRGERVYLSVVQNYREGGKTKTKTIESIGYVDQFTSQYADPIAHFQAYVAELNERAKSENPPIAFTFPRDATIDDTHIAQARWGSAIALAYLDALGVRRFFENRAGHVGFPAHAGRIFEMLASERMIHVAPKRETWQRRASFPRTCDFTLADTYAAFQCFARNERALVAHLSKTYQAIREPYQVNSVLLVLASFALADTGDVNATNARLAGGIDRDEGLSMGIGMLLDRTGIPMTYHVTSATPSADEVSGLVASAKSNFGAKRVIVVAGRTPHAREIAETLADSGDGFVFFRPLETAAFDLQAWVADASDYITTQSGSYKVKSRTDEMAGIRVKDTVLWGRDYAKIARKQGRAEDETRDLALDATFAYHQAKRSSPPVPCFTSIASCGASPSRFNCLNPISRLRPIPLPMPYTCARISWCATPHSSPCVCFAAIWDGAETPPKSPTRFYAWKAATWPRIGFCSAIEAP